MSIAIIARRRYCARVLELLKASGHVTIKHTDSKLFGTEELAVFTVSGEESDIIFIEKMIKGEFLSMDVLSYRFIQAQ